MSETPFVQAFLVTNSFPQTQESLFFLMQQNYSYVLGTHRTDLDFILDAGQDPDQVIGWSAPRWAMPGDLVFFYHAGKADHYINQLRKSLTQASDPLPEEREDIETFLNHAKHQARTFGSCIFAVGRVCSEIYRDGHVEEDAHHRGQIFVDIDAVHLFENPIPSKIFNRAVQVGQTTVTPVCGKSFEELKSIIQSHTSVPEFLALASASDRGFYNYTNQNWWSIACSSDTRFLHETQLRQYFADDFLKILKDPGSAILEECRTFCSGVPTGRADYMLRIDQNWYPVETKLNIHSERDLFSQLQKYQYLDSFVVTKGRRKGESLDCASHPWVFVLDQHGFFIVRERDWIECAQGSPWLNRTSIRPEKFTHLANDLRKILSHH